MSWRPTDADGLDINIANTRCQWDMSSKPSIALASVRIIFVRLLLLSCWPFWNVARQGTNASPLRKCQQRVGMATRINYYSMIKWGSRRWSDGFTMGFLSFGRPREGKRNASYSIFTFWYKLPSNRGSLLSVDTKRTAYKSRFWMSYLITRFFSRSTYVVVLKNLLSSLSLSPRIQWRPRTV